MVKKNADNAKLSQDASNTCHEAALNGKKVVDSVIDSIDAIHLSNGDIARQVEANDQHISEIVKLISEIENKTKIINDIVFQTKLLSFNASVEAARAGEHGKGFAVVAEEVGKLAEMSGNAAKEISQMLHGSIEKVEQIVRESKIKVGEQIAIGKGKVENGASTAKESGEVLDGIVKNVDKMNQMVSEISTASHEQAQGIQEINKAIAQMDQVTSQNAGASQHVATTAKQLTSEAESLHALVEALARTVQGSK